MTVDVVLKAVLVRPEYRHEASKVPVRPETKYVMFEKYWRKSRFALLSSDIHTTHAELVTSTCACGHRGHRTEACVGELSRFFLSSLGPCHITNELISSRFLPYRLSLRRVAVSHLRPFLAEH